MYKNVILSKALEKLVNMDTYAVGVVNMGFIVDLDSGAVLDSDLNALR